MGNKLNKLYYFYVNLILYENCPETMQTVSLVEKIIKGAVDAWLYSDEMSYSDIKVGEQVYIQAKAFIETFLGREIQFDNSIASKWNFSNLMDLLKSNARSKAVKAYFDV